ncbi:uncharacterized protein STEHIDRAFT_88565 [Stereum hirsutum FP-91666 SS1]|uniref:uncharacterized protein n=1 Tax=Stereum hirsutum (strain FP-91666) TaxID=721885 RepID=UPI000440BF6A|nr:uncharacterized protein STEHIDRAFT_88565 [Stereum hirsutum FP-91666 SS1]EIM91884.1 hypothetical protein STEHIDRAFT_88565 [Stereum hirsutum FP-91666 SS1]
MPGHLLILGSTGACGQLLVETLLDIPHSKSPNFPPGSWHTPNPALPTLTLYLRTPSKLPTTFSTHPNVTLVEGTLTPADEAKLTSAMTGVSAVLSAIGPSVKEGPDTPIAEAYKVVLHAMRASGVKRLIALGTPSITDEKDGFSLVYKAMVHGIALYAPNAYKDIVKVGEVIRGANEGVESGKEIEWTIVRVPALTSSNNKEVVAGYIGDGKTGATLARAGFAAFVAGELRAGEWIREAPLLTSA